MAYNDFTEMPVWKLGMEIVKDVYDITEQLPKREDYALCSQLRDAAVSIPGNVAEGFGRGHIKDKINFYLFSRGSACEVRSHLLVGQRVNYFREEQVSFINEKCKRTVEELNRIIKGLNAQHQLKSKP